MRLNRGAAGLASQLVGICHQDVGDAAALGGLRDILHRSVIESRRVLLREALRLVMIDPELGVFVSQDLRDTLH
jgi:hypothetical protein